MTSPHTLGLGSHNSPQGSAQAKDAAVTGSIPDRVAALRRAFDAGRTRPLEWRRAQLEGILKLLDERNDDLVKALQADLGKPDLEASMADLGHAKSETKLALRKLKKWTKPERVGVPIPLLGSSFILREPLGVVLIIAPWNYPVDLLFAPAAGAIAAGNAMVLKPSEITQRTSEVLARWIPEYLDSSAIAVVEGGVPETTALLEQRYDHIFYTGNGRVARVVLEAAARHLTPVTLELGGKSPCLVDRGVDLEVVARRIAWGKFMNAGQTCIAPDYVLAHKDVHDDLLRALADTVKQYYGDDPQRSPDFARIPNGAHHARLSKLIEGQNAVVGGETDAATRYVAPTVLRDVSPDAAVMQDEIFGPVLPVLRVQDMNEAVRFVNEREKPLALYLFSEDARTQRDVLERTSSGGACVNGTILHILNPALPFGGVGPSGTGAYHGKHTFETFSHRKSVLKRGLRFDPTMFYPPYSARARKLAKMM
jgi:aldehyde dehydrogenase (NAD+)